MQRTQALKDRIAASKAQNPISRSVTSFLFGGLKDLSCLCTGGTELKYLTQTKHAASTHHQLHRSFIEENCFGVANKSLTEILICFQQSAIAYLKFCKANHLHKLSCHYFSYKKLNFDREALSRYNTIFHKYLDRLYGAIQFRKARYSKMFGDMEIVIDC